MNCLLLGGAPSVGKSESIYRLTKYLLLNGFVDVTSTVPSTFKDFRAILEGKNKNGKQIRIIINTPTDTEVIICDFKAFFDCNGNYDILISSVRDDDFWPRNGFFRTMNLYNDFVLEIPLAKITRRDYNFKKALNWYQEKIDKLLIHTLKNNPFDL